MRVFQDAFVHGPPDQLADLVEDVSARAMSTGRWQRDWAAEARLAELGAAAPLGRAFTREPADGVPAVGLFLVPDEGAISVGNIVPRPSGSLSMDQYNAVLGDFVDTLLAPAAVAAGLALRLIPPDADITDWLSPQAAQLLRVFSGAANKWTGSAHPNDRQRWLAFLIQVHREEARLDADILLRWLVEELGWPEEWADRLIDQYEFGRGLLQAYDAA